MSEFMDKVQAEAESILEWPLQELVDTAKNYAKKAYIKKPFSETVASIVAQHERNGSISDKQRAMLARSIAFVTVGDGE